MLYDNIKTPEKEIKKITLTIASKSINCLGIKFNQEVKDYTMKTTRIWRKKLNKSASSEEGGVGKHCACFLPWLPQNHNWTTEQPSLRIA